MKTLIMMILKRPAGVSICFLAIIGGGILAAFRIPVDFLPRMEVPQITVASVFSGLPAADIRELITIPMEDSLSGLENLKRMRSSSQDGLSLIQLSLDWGTSMDLAALQAREIIDMAYLTLPSQADKPLVLPLNPGEEPVMILGVFPKTGADPSLVRDLADREIRSALQQVKGAGSLQVYGGRRDIIEVHMNQDSLGSRGLTLPHAGEVISGINAEYPSGSLDEGNTRYIIKTDGRPASWESLGDISLKKSSEDSPVPIRELGVVQRDYDKRQSFLLAGKEEGVAITVRRSGGFSPVSLSKNLTQKLTSLNNAYRKDLEIRVLLDSSQEISSTIRHLIQAGIMGAAAAFLVLWAFLKRLSYALITLSAVPLSFLGSFLGFKALGMTFNIMSLGGLTLGIGMLVDNAVVVLENLARRAPGRQKGQIAAAAAEITNATGGATLTSMVVFLPLLFLPGLLGEVFGDMAWGIIFPLGLSWIVSMTWIPLLFQRVSPAAPRERASPRPGGREGKALRFALRRPLLVGSAGLILLLAGGGMLPRMPFQWLQETKKNRIQLIVQYPSGTTVESIFSAASHIISFLEDQPGVLLVTASGGSQKNDPYFLADPRRNPERLDLMVHKQKNSPLEPGNLEKLMIQRLEQQRGVEIKAAYPQGFLNQVLDLNGGITRLLVSASSPPAALDLAESITAAMPPDQSFQIHPKAKKPQLKLIPQRESLARYGQTLSSLSSGVGMALNGEIISSFEESGRHIPIRLRLREEDRKDRKDLENLQIFPTERGPVLLRELVDFVEKQEPAVLFREGRRDVVYLDVPGEEAPQWLRQGAGKLVNPEAPLQKEQKKDILFIFFLAAALLFVLLGMQFNSFSLPVFFLITQSFSLSGGIILLGISGSGLNLNSILGMLIVLGLSINNVLLLYESYHRCRRQGLPLGWTIYAGTLSRVRPLLITGFTTILALLPLALDFSGRNPQNSLALSVVGGLLTSLPAALFLLPALFKAFFSMTQGKPQ